MRLDYSVFNTTTTASYDINLCRDNYVHIVTSDFHDIGHEKKSCCAALIILIEQLNVHVLSCAYI